MNWIQFASIKMCALMFPMLTLPAMADVVPLYTEDGYGTVEFTELVNPTDTVGVRFTADAAFNILRTNVATWGTTSGATLSIYDWQADYATSVAAPALHVHVATNVTDGAWIEWPFGPEGAIPDPTLPAGEYVLVFSDKAGGRFAPWANSYSLNDQASTLKNGTQVLVEVRAFNDDGTNNAEQLNNFDTFGQDFRAFTPFDMLKFKVATWGQPSASFDMNLFEWTTDYATSVAGTPVASRSWAEGDLSDNQVAEWPLGSALAAGHYLLVMSNAGSNGVVSWWRSEDSSWAGETYTAFRDGVRVQGDRQFWWWPSGSLDVRASIEFDSRIPVELSQMEIE